MKTGFQIDPYFPNNDNCVRLRGVGHIDKSQGDTVKDRVPILGAIFDVKGV
jgi:hypothetical protein